MVATRKYTQVWRTGDHDYSTEGGDWMKTNAKGTTISRDQKNAAWSLHSESVQPGTGSFTFKMGASCMRTTLQIISPFFFSSASNNVTCTFFCSRRCDAVETRSGKRKCETGCGNEERNCEAVELLCRPLPQDLLSSPPSLFPYVQSTLEWCD